jgi:hypothetical protein
MSSLEGQEGGSRVKIYTFKEVSFASRVWRIEGWCYMGSSDVLFLGDTGCRGMGANRRSRGTGIEMGKGLMGAGADSRTQHQAL